MRFAIFAPGTSISAIGRMAALVSRSLVAQGHQVTIVRTEDSSDTGSPAHDFGATAVHWSHAEQVRALLKKVDMAVHHVGDNYPLHKGNLEWLPLCRGIVCLHDYFLGGLFWGWAADRRPLAMGILRSWYGERAAQDFFRYESAGELAVGTHATSPMTEWIAEMADAVITHSSWNIDRVLNVCAGPVRVVPLPYDIRPIESTQRSSPSPGEGRGVVLTVGNMNPNKRADSVILAIGSSPVLREKLVYRLMGAIEPQVAEQLTLLAEKAGVALDIRGEVDDETLDLALRQAEIVCCLRLPPLEAASASTIEAMLHGKAVVVMNTGFYRDIPDHLVRKVEPENEIGDLRAALDSLHADKTSRTAMGQQAKEWAKQTFDASNYARQVVEVSLDVFSVKPVDRMLRHFAEIAAQWSKDPSQVMNSDTVAPLRILNSTADVRYGSLP